MSAEKLFDILDLFSEKKIHFTVPEIAELMDIPQSSIYRHVKVLKEKGFLTETEGGYYKLGYRFIEFANIVRMDSSLTEITLPFMKKLTYEFEETTILSILSNFYAVCLETVPSLQPIKVSSEQGKIVPLYAGASSKAILAFQPEQLVHQLFERNLVKKHTDRTLSEKETLLNNLTEIRKRGYAVSDSEIDDGVFSYGFPIKKSNQEVFASLTISGPRERMLQKNEKEIIETFTNVVREVEKFL